MPTNTSPRLGHGRNLRALKYVNPARASEFPRRPRLRPAKKHCAAQAEYSRLAAQAYSPSGAMSQARFCLGRMKKVQCRPRPICRAICMLKRGLAADVSVARTGWSSRFSPSSATSLHSPMRRGRLASCAKRGPAWGLRFPPLLLARRIRLPWRNVRPRRRVRPARLRRPGRLRRAAKAQVRCEEIDSMLLKHRQDGFVGGDNLYVHDADIARAS